MGLFLVDLKNSLFYSAKKEKEKKKKKTSLFWDVSTIPDFGLKIHTGLKIKIKNKQNKQKQKQKQKQKSRFLTCGRSSLLTSLFASFSSYISSSSSS